MLEGNRLPQSAQQPQDPVEDGQRVRRAPRHEQVDGDGRGGSLVRLRTVRRRDRPRSRMPPRRSRSSARRPPPRSSRGRAACCDVTGPVTSSPSACRGEATNRTPKRPMSHPMVVRTLLSASQALHPPALTWRRQSDLPNSRRVVRSRAVASLSAWLPRTRSSRVRVASRWSRLKARAPAGHASVQSVQNRHRPRSISIEESAVRRSAPVGHDSDTAGTPFRAPGRVDDRQPPEPFAHGRRLAAGVPRGAEALSYSLGQHRAHRSVPLQVVPAVREVEALVAEREIGDLAAPHGERQPEPVVERGIDHVVALEAPRRNRSWPRGTPPRATPRRGWTRTIGEPERGTGSRTSPGRREDRAAVRPRRRSSAGPRASGPRHGSRRRPRCPRRWGRGRTGTSPRGDRGGRRVRCRWPWQPGRPARRGPPSRAAGFRCLRSGPSPRASSRAAPRHRARPARPRRAAPGARPRAGRRRRSPCRPARRDPARTCCRTAPRSG